MDASFGCHGFLKFGKLGIKVFLLLLSMAVAQHLHMCQTSSLVYLANLSFGNLSFTIIHNFCSHKIITSYITLLFMLRPFNFPFFAGAKFSHVCSPCHFRVVFLLLFCSSVIPQTIVQKNVCKPSGGERSCTNLPTKFGSLQENENFWLGAIAVFTR